MQLSEDDVVPLFIGVIAFLVMFIATNVAFYHYGYFEGKTAVLEKVQPKPEPAK